MTGWGSGGSDLSHALPGYQLLEELTFLSEAGSGWGRGAAAPGRWFIGCDEDALLNSRQRREMLYEC